VVFDFSIALSPASNVEFKPNPTHAKYLQNVDFQRDTIKGKNFHAEYFAHPLTKEEGIYSESGLFIFLMGKLYPNRKLSSETSPDIKQINMREIVKLYAKYGEGFINYLKGVYVLVLIDENNNKSFAYASRSGLYKIYYCLEGNRLLLGTSIHSVRVNRQEANIADDVGILQHGLFQHPLGTRTNIQNINILDNFSYLSYDFHLLEVKQTEDLHISKNGKSEFDWSETYHRLPQEFDQVMDAIVPRTRFNCALTGGFDSRTIVSYLVNRPELEYRLYSWAADERWHDVEVAKSIAGKLGISYSAILLNENMLDQYCYYAAQHIYWTDGLGSINRTNQMYSHWQLSKYSRNVMTGYFGSELFRPMSRHNIMISDVFVDTYLHHDRKSAIHKALINLVEDSPFTKEFIEKHLDETVEATFEYFKNLDVTCEKGNNLFIYLIKSGFWKFYGQEFHAQRIHNSIQSPYMDDDFIDFLLRTPVWEINRRTYKLDPYSMLKGQAIYLPILKANSSLLMNHPTNRGFSPADFESWLFPWNVVIKHHFHKKKLLKRNILGFNSKAWNKLVFTSDPATITRKSEIFGELNQDHLKSGFWYSLKRHLESCEHNG
jgi:hypothetical protein